jgi:hypothetical protein
MPQIAEPLVLEPNMSVSKGRPIASRRQPSSSTTRDPSTFELVTQPRNIKKQQRQQKRQRQKEQQDK